MFNIHNAKSGLYPLRVNDVPYAGMTSVKLRAMIKQLVDEAKNPVVVRKAD